MEPFPIRLRITLGNTMETDMNQETEPIRRLYRSPTDSRLAGVCGGLGRYLRFDPVVVRLLWVAITLITGLIPGLLAYLVAWIIVPLEPQPMRAHAPADQPNEGTL